jgi:hypothetical protein
MAIPNVISCIFRRILHKSLIYLYIFPISENNFSSIGEQFLQHNVNKKSFSY